MAKNKRQLKKQEKNETKKALDALVESGAVAEMVFTSKVEKQKTETLKEDSETSIGKSYLKTEDSMKNAVNSINEVVKIFKNTTAFLAERLVDKLEEKKALEYKAEEAQAAAQAVPVKKERPTVTGAGEEEKSVGSLFKDFLTNPVIVAAFSGLVYLFLPKDVKENIQAFFKGFKEGVSGVNTEMDSFKMALLAAAAGLATYLGASVLKSIAEAITTTMSLIAKARTGIGKLKNLSTTGKVVAGAVVATGAVAAGTAVAKSMEKDEEERKKQEEAKKTSPNQELKPSLEAKPATAGTAPSQPQKLPESKDRTSTESESLGKGLKPNAKVGLQLPSGSDADVKKMIIHHEGIRYKPYKDSLGLWTVGVGHLIGDGKTLPPEYNRTFSHDEVMTMFDKDYKHHKQAAEKIPGYSKLNDRGEAALIDLTFNMGPAWYKRWPNFTKSLQEGDTEGAAKSLESSKWYTQVGVRAPTIVSLIRAGGEGGKDKTLNIPTIQPVAKTASLEPSIPSTGIKVAQASEKNVSDMETVSSGIINNNINNSRRLANKKGPDAPAPIPSPMADRGSLNISSSHSSAYNS